jgi:hypothetical protein
MHVPLHVMPQPPQFALSVSIVSTQLPAQQLSVPHGFPQPPQLFGSLVMSTHWLLQHVLALPRQPLPQLPPPESCGGVTPESFGVVPESFGVVPESFGGVPESLPTTPESFVVPSSSAAPPVAQPLAQAQTIVAAQIPGPKMRMPSLAYGRV